MFQALKIQSQNKQKENKNNDSIENSMPRSLLLSMSLPMTRVH